MRNIPINDVDHLPQAVLALGSDYPADTLLDTIRIAIAVHSSYMHPKAS